MMQWRRSRAVWGVILGVAATSQAGLFSGWNYRLSIQAGQWLNGEPLTNFPVLVVLGTHLEGFGYDQFLSPPFGDLRFSDVNETNEFSYEVEAWDVGGSSWVWVRVPVLTNGTVIKALWGKSGENAPPYTTNGAVWANQFGAVYHLSHSPTNPAPQIRDSTAFTNHGTCFGNMTAGQLTNGAVGKGLRFDGVDDYVNCGNSASLQPAHVTFSCWVKPMGIGSSSEAVWAFSKGRSGVSPYFSFGFQFWPDRSIIRSALGLDRDRYGSEIPFYTNSPFTHFTATYNRTNLITYQNGQVVTVSNYNAAINYNLADPNLHLGQWIYSTFIRRINGILDEVRIEQVARSSNWVWATYLNMASNDLFFAYGPAQKKGGTLIFLR